MDKYDKAIAFLTEHPEMIREAWYVPDDGDSEEIKSAHCLFQVVDKFNDLDGERLSSCGCLTQIRSGNGGSWARGAICTAEIRSDTRIPDVISDVGVEHLPVFAEWQRKLDKELGRSP